MTSDETVEGIVKEELAGGLLKVEIDGIGERLATISGKMRMNHIRVIIGDRVLVVLDPYGGKTTNRITRRL